MKNIIKNSVVIAIVVIIGVSMIACDFFKEKDCSHCGGTGDPCSWLNPCSNCVTAGYECWVCSGTGKVPDW